MKYPKLWDEGASPIGEGHIRAFDRVDTPYMTGQGPDSTAYKKNGFNEVHSKKGELKFPYLWGTYVIDGTPHDFLKISVFSPEDNVGRTQAIGRVYNPAPDNVGITTCYPFVGEGYVLYVNCNTTATTLVSAIFWPMLERAVNVGDQYLSTDPTRYGIDPETDNPYDPYDVLRREWHTTNFADVCQITGLGEQPHNIRLWASGWENEDTHYRFGMSALTPGAVFATTRIPVIWTGSTVLGTMEQQAFPYYANSLHLPFNVYCIGPGRLRTVQFVASALSEGGLGAKNPYMAESYDHGATWVAGEFAWLTALLYDYSAGSGVPTFSAAQQYFMSISVVSAYLGAGKTMFYVGNAYIRTDHIIDGDYYVDIYAPAFFIEFAGVFTRKAWPADDWITTERGLHMRPTGEERPLTEGRWLSLMFSSELDAAHMAFGVGCFYVGMFDEGVAKIMFTRDFGESWTISAGIPANIATEVNHKIVGTMIRPYVSADDPGRLVFAAPDYVANKMRYYSTDGNFSKWILIGYVVKAQGDLIPGPVTDAGHYYVNYGGAKFPPRVYPAFPDEFMEPNLP